MSNEPLHINPMEVTPRHRAGHEGYEYYQRDLVPFGHAGQCFVSLYEIPSGKSAYPYHYHAMNEEVFYILSGSGSLKTPEGEKTVRAGELLFFPAAESGAHKLTNTSETEPLVFLDFDTRNDIDVAVYPDSDKIGIWGKGINQIHRTERQVEYFDGE